jgi:hypothetical protein
MTGTSAVKPQSVLSSFTNVSRSAEGRSHLILRKLPWRQMLINGALVGFIVLHVYLGTRGTANSAYSTEAGVFGEYMNGVIRLVFPLLVLLLAGVPLHDQVVGNFIAFTRGRAKLNSYIVHLACQAMTRTFVYFVIVGLVTTLAATYLAPALQPGLVQPATYGLTPDQAIQQQMQMNPLAFALLGGPLVYGLTCTLWMMIGSGVLVLATLASIMTLRPRLSLLVPLAFFIGESVLAQLLGAPQVSLLLVLPSPSNLQSFPFGVAIIPLLAIAVISLALILWAIRSTYKSGRFS